VLDLNRQSGAAMRYLAENVRKVCAYLTEKYS